MFLTNPPNTKGDKGDKGDPGTLPVTENFTPLNGQISFTLAVTPNQIFMVFVNSGLLDENEYSLNNNIFTYTGTDFQLSNKDILKIKYF